MLQHLSQNGFFGEDKKMLKNKKNVVICNGQSDGTYLNPRSYLFEDNLSIP